MDDKPSYNWGAPSCITQIMGVEDSVGKQFEETEKTTLVIDPDMMTNLLISHRKERWP